MISTIIETRKARARDPQVTRHDKVESGRIISSVGLNLFVLALFFLALLKPYRRIALCIIVSILFAKLLRQSVNVITLGSVEAKDPYLKLSTLSYVFIKERIPVPINLAINFLKDFLAFSDQTLIGHGVRENVSTRSVILL